MKYISQLYKHTYTNKTDTFIPTPNSVFLLGIPLKNSRVPRNSV